MPKKFTFIEFSLKLIDLILMSKVFTLLFINQAPSHS